MRRYKFFSSYVYPVSLMCDALVYVCVYGCMLRLCLPMFLSMLMYIRAFVCGVWVLPLLHVHSPYDTTMTRLSRLEKGSGAREAPATQ